MRAQLLEEADGLEGADGLQAGALALVQDPVAEPGVEVEEQEEEAAVHLRAVAGREGAQLVAALLVGDLEQHLLPAYMLKNDL